MGHFLRLFTELSLDEIARLEILQDAEINEAKKILANEATTMCHGPDAAAAAAETAKQTFEEGNVGADLPTIEIPESDLRAGINLVELLGESWARLCHSNGEARRLIKGGGARVNDEAIHDEKAKVSNIDITADGSDQEIALSALTKIFVVLVTLLSVANVGAMIPFVANTRNWKIKYDEATLEVAAANKAARQESGGLCLRLGTTDMLVAGSPLGDDDGPSALLSRWSTETVALRGWDAHREEGFSWFVLLSGRFKNGSM